MKKNTLFLLLFIAARATIAYSQPYFVPDKKAMSQTTFSPVEPGNQACNFFFWLPEKNRIWFDLARIDHLYLLPDVDSLVKEVNRLIAPVADSFATDAIVRRVEVDATQKHLLFRVIAHANMPASYTRLDDDLTIVKIDQDTVRIKFYQDNGGASFINLLVNNIADLKTLPKDAGNQSLKLIKDHLYKSYKHPMRYNPRHSYYAVFNLESGEMISPENGNNHAIVSGSDQLEISPGNPSAAYARGIGFTGLSFGLALNFAKVRGANGHRNSFGLYWEPQFSFRRDSTGSHSGFRNDFITLRYVRTPNKPLSNFQLLPMYSFGYLMRNRGNYFEKNTFCIGAWGVASGNLQINPEIYFNDFFKQVSPGIRLSLKIF